MEAETSLEVAGRALLLGVGAEQGGVDVEYRPSGPAPSSKARSRAACAPP